MKIVGVDPGIRGGLAVIAIEDGAAPLLLDAIDIPVIGMTAKERVDVLALRQWILSHCPTHAVIERAQAMPKQGSSSGFKYGRAVGSIEAAITLCEIPITIAEPSVWKRRHQVCAVKIRKARDSWRYSSSPLLTLCWRERKITDALKLH